MGTIELDLPIVFIFGIANYPISLGSHSSLSMGMINPLVDGTAMRSTGYG